MSKTSLGRRQNTLLKPDADADNVPGVTRNLCYLSVLSQMMWAIPWKMRMNLEEDFAIFGEAFSRHERKASMKFFLRYVQQALDDISWTI